MTRLISIESQPKKRCSVGFVVLVVKIVVVVVIFVVLGRCCCSRNLTLKVGQNQGSNSLDIANMDKCHQNICCLDKYHLESWHLLNIVPGTCLSSLVKTRSVTAEIMLIWTIVFRTYVD